MATTVYTTEEITLRNGESVTLAPLSIKYLKKFMDSFNELPKDEDEKKVLDALSNLAAICLQGCGFKLTKSTDDDVEDEEWEDILDSPTINHVIKATTGFDFSGEAPKETTPTIPEIIGTI